MFVPTTKSTAQCTCALVVGSGQGAGVTNLSQVPAAQNLNNACIRIKGIFYIDNNQTWNLTNETQVYLDPDASIYVNSGSGINANDECVFQKCNSGSAAWGSIVGFPNSTITIDRCTLYDAQTAISMSANAAFWLTNNRFERFGTGLRINGIQNQLTHQVQNNQFLEGSQGIWITGSSVRINYNYFYHTAANMLGIKIFGGQSVAINDCILTNQALGVQVDRTSNNITLNNVTISGIRGVYASQCDLNFGIYRSSIRTQQEGVLIADHRTSIGSKFGSAVVDGSYVSSIYKSAIRDQNIYGNGRLHVLGNTIRPPYDPPSFAHYGVEIDNVPSAPGGSGGITANDVWAAETLGDLPGYAAVHWDARRDLYDKLRQYPALINESGTISGFYDDAEEGNIGIFQAVVEGLIHLYDPPTNIEEDYYDATDLRADQYAALDALDEIIEEAEPEELPALLAQRDSIVEEIELTLAVIHVYDSIIAAAVPQRMSDLITLNASADPEADYDEYQQDINAIYLDALYNDDWEFDSTTQAAIDAIAELCPQDAGRAVYDARSLQAHYRVPVWTDCAPIDAPRTTSTSIKPAGKGFWLYPNPATDQVQIVLEAPATAGSRAVLLDMTGRVLLDLPIASGNANAELPVGKLQNGVYLIQIRQANAPAFQQKLTIIR